MKANETKEEKRRKEEQRIQNGREHCARLYAASAKKAREQGGGRMTATDDDLAKVGNDIEIQELLDHRDGTISGSRPDLDYKTLVRDGRLKTARKRGTHSTSEWKALLEEFDYRCLRCGCSFYKGLTKDHIVPLSMGGDDAIENIQPLCRQCNSSSGGAGHTFNWIVWRRTNGFGLGTNCFCWLKKAKV